LLPGQSKQLATLKVGEGRVFRSGVGRYAAFKNEAGEISVFSAVCPHMKCVVHWNNAQKSFDCPCHGSRFNTAGEVIEGPALQGLSRVEEEEAQTPLRRTRT